MDVQDMQIFARVAAVQNLSSVGSELNLTPGTISKRLQALEQDLGAKLFDRNTRSIRITQEGEKLLEYVERILIEIEHARAAISVNVEQPRGRLRVAAPISLGAGELSNAINAFMEMHSEIDVQIDLTDRPVSLQEEGYDVVISRGTPSNAGLMRKPLAPDPQVIAASPTYLQRFGTPTTPDELAKHVCLLLGDVSSWEFSRKGVRHSVRVSGRLRSDNSDLLQGAALAGMGIVRTSRWRCQDSLKAGYLRRLLPQFDVVADSTLCALYPNSRHMLPKLRVFLDFLAEWFRDSRAERASAVSARAR
jgi:DNA-binding transcriptional LysR family regulator